MKNITTLRNSKSTPPESFQDILSPIASTTSNAYSSQLGVLSLADQTIPYTIVTTNNQTHLHSLAIFLLSFPFEADTWYLFGQDPFSSSDFSASAKLCQRAFEIQSHSVIQNFMSLLEIKAFYYPQLLCSKRVFPQVIIPNDTLLIK